MNYHYFPGTKGISMSLSALTQEDLKLLKSPFPKESLGVKVQATSKAKDKAMLVLYLQHTDVQDRLDQVDPNWRFEILNESMIDQSCYVKARLTLKGTIRENVGEGTEPKGAYSDALKRCAMLFGVGRFLYDSPTVWVSYDESRDRFKTWTYDDYERSLPSPRPIPPQTSKISQGDVFIPKVRPAPISKASLITDQQRKLLFSQLPLKGWDYEKHVKPYIKAQFKIDSGWDLNVHQFEQVLDLVQKKTPEEILQNEDPIDFGSVP